MQFLRTLFWVVVAIVAVIFSMNNWHAVRVELWANIAADVKLPVLIFGAFLAGLLPPLILHRVSRWRYRRRLDVAERSLVEARAVGAAPVEPLSPAPTTVPPPPLVPVPSRVPCACGLLPRSGARGQRRIAPVRTLLPLPEPR